MFEDFLKRMNKGFGATMFFISLPAVMLVTGLLCYLLISLSPLDNHAFRLSCCGAVIGGAVFAYKWNSFLNSKDE